MYVHHVFSHVRLCATPRTVVRRDPLSMEFSRQEYWSGLPFLTPGDLPNPGIKPTSPALQADSLPLSHLGSPYRMVDFGKSYNLSTHQLSHQQNQQNESVPRVFVKVNRIYATYHHIAQRRVNRSYWPFSCVCRQMQLVQCCYSW